MEEEKPATPLAGVGKTPDQTGQSAPRLLAKNRGEPIKLTGVNMHGVSAEAARSGEMVKIWTRLVLTSDDRIFHTIVDNVGATITQLAQETGRGADH
jgi:hypothetical protein